MKKIISVVGARPNFMKIAPLLRAIEYHNQASSPKVEHTLVHTGQHYDDRMSKAFFEELGIPQADINLGIGSGSHAEQVGHTMIALEKVFIEEQPDWVVVVGDVNATLAATVTAKKLCIRVCHIEAGLRSGDMTMPEEINRLVTDRLSDLLLTPDVIANENLRKEGTPEKNIKFVGNIMIDTLEHNFDKAKNLDIPSIITQNLSTLNSEPRTQNPELRTQNGSRSEQNPEPFPPFAVVTLHRPSNVDNPDILGALVKFITGEVCSQIKVLWTLHPRTAKMLSQFGLLENMLSQENLTLLEPLSYLSMLKLNMNARVLLTDSGGLQEECTVLGTPCITLRWNTERPVTLREHGGASILVGNNIERIQAEFNDALNRDRTPFRPELWDGQTAGRCLKAIIGYDEQIE